MTKKTAKPIASRMNTLTNTVPYSNEKISDEDMEEIKANPMDVSSQIEFDETDLINNLIQEKNRIDTARTNWINRKLEFLHQWDDFIEYKHERILPQQRYMHYPLTFEKMQSWHSRMMEAVFSFDPIFSMKPLNKVSKNEVDATKQILAWYLRDQINEGEGLYSVFDELLWDLGTDGWGCIYKLWQKKVRLSRQIVDPMELRREVQEISKDIRRRGRPRKDFQEYSEVPKLITLFDGITLETLPHESVYFPDYIPTSSNLNKPPLVMLETFKTAEDLTMMATQGYYDQDAVDEILEKGKGFSDTNKQQLVLERERLAGLNKQIEDFEKIYPIYICFLRKDMDGDGMPEEYVISTSFKAKKVCKITFLDKFCKDYGRPIYKFDLMKRPRSGYSRGFVEVLHPFNTEMDEMHNIRRASGLIANVPWGFYRATSGLEKEILEVAPGKFYPVDDPASDVVPMRFGNVTAWSLQEEQLSYQNADRVTSMPSILQGSVGGPVGPLRSTSGVNALTSLSSAPMKLYLKRFHGPLNQMLQGILSDLRSRLPQSVEIAVLGEKSEAIFGEKGEMAMMNISRKLMEEGRYKFWLSANDANQNPEIDKQNAMAVGQALMTQFPIQMGIVSPLNAYYVYKDLLEKNNVLDIDKFITKPQGTLTPMGLSEEYTAICAGRVPMIVLNDDHESKINGLMALMQSPEYQEGKALGNISPLADPIFGQVIQTHQKYLQIIQSMPAMNNQSGSQLPATMGAESAGVGRQQAAMQGQNPSGQVSQPPSQGGKQ